MNLEEQIYIRKSCRKYLDDEIDMDIIHDFMSSVKPLNRDIHYHYDILAREEVNVRNRWSAPYYLALYSEKKENFGENIGFVGEVIEVKTKILTDFLNDDFLPVICPIGLDDNFLTYNINADDVACAIAKSLKSEKLVFLTDTKGVYKDKNDQNTLISKISIKEAKKLIESGFIEGGMLPKLNNCIEAIETGVNSVHILDGRIIHSLLLEIFTNDGIGTVIINN